MANIFKSFAGITTCKTVITKAFVPCWAKSFPHLFIYFIFKILLNPLAFPVVRHLLHLVFTVVRPPQPSLFVSSTLSLFFQVSLSVSFPSYLPFCLWLSLSLSNKHTVTYTQSHMYTQTHTYTHVYRKTHTNSLLLSCAHTHLFSPFPKKITASRLRQERCLNTVKHNVILHIIPIPTNVIN